jgi:2',3'-cyclic-nucleotide 2'-phosphodiesterase (5'-nucleotidase family)
MKFAAMSTPAFVRSAPAWGPVAALHLVLLALSGCGGEGDAGTSASGGSGATLTAGATSAGSSDTDGSGGSSGVSTAGSASTSGTTTGSTSAPGSTSAATTATTEATTGPLPEVREITVLYTNDEHGWMEGQDPASTAAHMVTMWREMEGYTPDGPFVVLSGGDMWTGPAISTFFEGESMTEVMSAMRYDAAAVGNHEFDFGLDALALRAAEATFPILSANTRWRDDGQVPTDLGIGRSAVLDVYGLKIGVIGLTTQDTPTTTLPANVEPFDFIDYEQALREVVPELRAQDVDLIFVPGHVCMYELEPLADRIADLEIDLLGGGHCNELVAQERNGVVLLEGGSYLRSYAWAKFTYDTTTRQVIDKSFGERDNAGATADADVKAIIDKWAAMASVELDRVIGYLAQDVARRSDDMYRLITDPVVAQFPDVDLYMTNKGSVRADLLAGDITVGDVVSILPFDNTLVRVELTGTQINEVAAQGGGPAIGGGQLQGSQVVLDATGAAVQAGTTYSVMVSSFMYQGGDGYDKVMMFDTTPIDTGIHFRDPVIAWIEAQGSSQANPLNW